MGKLRPILFSTDMVRAILEGRKTQTRRLNGLKAFNQSPNSWILREMGERGIWLDETIKENPDPIRIAACFTDFNNISSGRVHIDSPYGKPGDVLWVRETFIRLVHRDRESDYGYLADLAEPGENLKWKPSIHMPYEAARIFLRIKSVRVERLQKITDQDALAEGTGFYDRDAFEALWVSIYGHLSWENSPWVWVIEFERISKVEALK